MKKIISLLLAICLLISVNTTIFASDPISVTLDGNYIEFDVHPQIINGRTMVPIRAIFEKMGAVVEWDGNTSSAICTKGDTVVQSGFQKLPMYPIREALILPAKELPPGLCLRIRKPA